MLNKLQGFKKEKKEINVVIVYICARVESKRAKNVESQLGWTIFIFKNKTKGGEREDIRRFCSRPFGVKSVFIRAGQS